MHDPYNLHRFVEAQDPVYDRVLSELRQGCKTSHWMWFIFPQIEGLGHSSIAIKFAVSSLEEATAYIEHPVLGPRLLECATLVNDIAGRTIDDIFGYPDDLKFRSCMTLFSHTPPRHDVFRKALQKYFNGEEDAGTLQKLKKIDTR